MALEIVLTATMFLWGATLNANLNANEALRNAVKRGIELNKKFAEAVPSFSNKVIALSNFLYALDCGNAEDYVQNIHTMKADARKRYGVDMYYCGLVDIESLLENFKNLRINNLNEYCRGPIVTPSLIVSPTPPDVLAKLLVQGFK